MNEHLINERAFNIDSKQVREAVEILLENGIPKDIPYIEEWVLSQALCKRYHPSWDEGEKTEKTAKKILKKYGSEAIKAALKLKSRRDYLGSSAEKYFDDDMKELAEKNIISTPQFAKFVLLNGTNNFYPAQRHFIENLTDEEEARTFFAETSREGSVYYFKFLIAMNANLLKILFEVMEENAENVRSIVIVGGNEVSLTEIDFSKFSILTDLRIYDYEGDIPESLAKATNLQRFVFLDSKIDAFPEIFENLKNLTYLSLSGEFATLAKGIVTLPEECQMRFDELKVRTIPETFFDSDLMPRENIDELLKSVGHDIPYTNVCSEFNVHIDQYYGVIPIIGDTLRRYSETEDAVETQMRELLMAFAKCVYDDEHGRSSNNFWSDEVKKHAPKDLVEIESLLSTYKFINYKSNFENIRKNLADAKHFNVDAFIKFAVAISESNREKYQA